MTRITRSKRPAIALALTLVPLFLTAGGLAKTYSHLSEGIFAKASSPIPPVLSERSRVAAASRTMEANRALTLDAEPVVVTDKTGYLGGENVVITGSGFAHGDLVTLRIKHAD